ncbi:carbohydrate kinase family protein [Parachitinimonas caeni]|uniref:Carbohydrate kinase family protein n=1 Tax=Parachitinimonas caeni TaxID=3031301 RepID=A0ABT7DRL7_9NEIS|nr:carbohydrate kinase family protein [Parachitinimonas caeni]MDK2122439.1 carbohydrate kinase family protein [Parachitinimonas caeni]
MSVLVSGSVAYDTIMVFQDQFKNHILPDKVHMLSVSFLVPELRREFGGCAGNIAYNLKLLGGEPLIVATAGQDFGPYSERLDQLGIRSDAIRVLPDYFTPQCFITTDVADNQITAFHPGAMGRSDENKPDLSDVTLGIVGPDGLRGMQCRCEEMAEVNIPFIFDPGQAMPLFTGEELLACIRSASYLAVNDYEAELMQHKTGKTIDELAKEVKALIVTLGAEGSRIYADGKVLAIPPAPARAVVDPTGCGDAYRAGLLHGITHGWDWHASGRLASLLGAIKIAERGAQNHTFTPESLAESYLHAFGERWPG